MHLHLVGGFATVLINTRVELAAPALRALMQEVVRRPRRPATPLTPSLPLPPFPLLSLLPLTAWLLTKGRKPVYAAPGNQPPCFSV